jgi:DNA polymerase delta subunit 1
MLNGSDITSAVEVARKAKNELMSGQVPIEQLYLSKQLKTDYKTDNHAHVQVAKKMRDRAPGSEPQTGDRVRYVIVKGDKKSKLYEKSEDPVYVMEQKIPLDYDYYFKNQMLTPILNLIGSVIPEDKIFV